MVMPVYSHKRYAELLTDTFDIMAELGKLKGGEYAGDKDRLANFRRNGIAMDLPMETIWRVYAGKHWDAITQYIVDLQNGTKRQRIESISGRVDDMLVYLVLLKCMIDERESATPPAEREIDRLIRACRQIRGESTAEEDYAEALAGDPSIGSEKR